MCINNPRKANLLITFANQQHNNMNVPHMNPPRVKIFSGTNTTALATEIARNFGKDLGKASIQKFSDGEFQPVFQESIRGDYVFLVQSTSAPSDNLMELLMMIDAARRASAGYITAVIPYFGFARQDRKDKPRVSIASKLVANLLTTAGANRIMTMDLHAPQIQGFFDIPVDHLDSSAIFIPYIEQLNIPNLTFASPDVGSTNRVREVASYFGADMVICDKQRKRANEVASMTVIGDVRDKDLVLIDDICDTAGTLTKSAAMLMDKGAKSVRAFCTHPVLSGKAYENIANSVLSELVVCDTIPLKEKVDKIKVLGTAELFSIAILHTFENKSIHQLFIHSKLKEKAAQIIS
jgi:ribose-phosphate pyrophosphokinase